MVRTTKNGSKGVAMRVKFAGFFVTVFSLLGVLGLAPSAAQDADIPNFSGFWVRTVDEGRTFLPPPSGPGPIERAEDAGPFRIADLDNPILGQQALEAVSAHSERGRAGVIQQPAWVTCWPVGVPGILNMNDAIQILQTPDKVTIMHQRDNQVRHIYLNAQHPATMEPSWYGYSVGHYEGNSLVVDTRGQNDRATIDRFGTPRSEKLRVVERYTIAPDRSSIRVELNVEDPEMFTTPWSARASYEPDTPFYEQICAENNKDPTGGTFDMPIATHFEF
jgi:hypothetical protein